MFSRGADFGECRPGKEGEMTVSPGEQEDIRRMDRDGVPRSRIARELGGQREHRRQVRGHAGHVARAPAGPEEGPPCCCFSPCPTWPCACRTPLDSPSIATAFPRRAGKEKCPHLLGTGIVWGCHKGDTSDGLPYEKRADGKGEAVCIAEEVPFGLPKGWAWARIASIANEPMYGTSRKSEAAGKMPVLRMGNITRVGTINYDDLAYTSFDSDIKQYALQAGDVIFNRTNSQEWVGKVAYYEGSIPAIYAGYLVRFRTIEIDSHYVTQAMCSPYERDWCNRVKTDGVNQSNINVKKLKAFLLPVPPLAEQRRIVAALDRCLSLVDTVERDGGELEALFRRLRSKVLDLAIRGELTEHDPADEPAVELLARIHDEKLAMVGRGELKPKDVKGDTVIFTGSDGLRYEKRADGRGEPVCIEDEIPFDIPETWAWARLESLCLPQEKRTPSEGSFNYIDIGNIDNQRHVISGPNRVEKQDAPSRAARAVEGTSTVFSMVRPYLRNIAFVGERYRDSIASTGFYVITPVGLTTNPRWLNYLMLSDYAVNTINSHMKGDNSPSVRKEDMNSLLLPVPPLSEQSRITNHIDEISRFITNL